MSLIKRIDGHWFEEDTELDLLLWPPNPHLSVRAVICVKWCQAQYHPWWLHLVVSVT